MLLQFKTATVSCHKMAPDSCPFPGIDAALGGVNPKHTGYVCIMYTASSFDLQLQMYSRQLLLPRLMLKKLKMELSYPIYS